MLYGGLFGRTTYGGRIPSSFVLVGKIVSKITTYLYSKFKGIVLSTKNQPSILSTKENHSVLSTNNSGTVLKTKNKKIVL